MSDKYPGISHYAYCFNNPLNLVDPTGMEPSEGDDFYKNKETAEIDWLWTTGDINGYENLGTSYNKNGSWGTSENGVVAQGSMDGSYVETVGGDLPGIYIEGKTTGNSTVSSTPWVDIAESQVGIREVGSTNSGPDVEKYFKSSGLAQGNAWCGAFVNWSFKQSGIEVDGFKEIQTGP